MLHAVECDASGNYLEFIQDYLPQTLKLLTRHLKPFVGELDLRLVHVMDVNLH